MEYVGTALAEMTMPQISPLAGEPIEEPTPSDSLAS